MADAATACARQRAARGGEWREFIRKEGRWGKRERERESLGTLQE